MVLESFDIEQPTIRVDVRQMRAYPHCSTAMAVATNVNAGTIASGRLAVARPAVARIAPTIADVPELAETTEH